MKMSAKISCAEITQFDDIINTLIFIIIIGRSLLSVNVNGLTLWLVLVLYQLYGVNEENLNSYIQIQNFKNYPWSGGDIWWINVYLIKVPN